MNYRIGSHVFFVAAFLAALPPRLAVAQLTLDVTPFVFTLEAGNTATARGQITNITGAPLNSSDLFFNFGNFDPSIFDDFTQLLGVPDFIIPDRSRSPVVDLFRFSVASTAPPGAYEFTAQVQDIANNVSNPVVGNVTVSGIPEPTALLFGLGVTSFLGSPNRRKNRGHVADHSGNGFEQVR